MLSNTSERMAGVYLNHVDTSLSIFYWQEQEDNNEVGQGEGESDKDSAKNDGSRMDEEDDNTLEKWRTVIRTFSAYKRSHKTTWKKNCCPLSATSCQ